MKKIFSLGIGTKLFLVFSLSAIALFVGWWQVYQASNELVVEKTAQASAVEGLGALKGIQQVLADANLLGMDIIVDHSENPTAKVHRTGEFADFKGELALSSKKWAEAFKVAGIQGNFAEIERQINSLVDTIGELIAAIDRGERDPSKYAKFDEDIDGAKVAASKLVADLHDKIEKEFLTSQKNMDVLVAAINFTLVKMIVTCMVLFLVVGVPIIVSLSRSIRKLQNRLTEITNSVHGTSSGLAESSQSLADASSQAAAAIQESVSAMTEMSAMLAQTSRNAESTTNLSRDVLDQSRSGIAVMEEMLQSMKVISESSARLKEIVQVIENISAKTNVINDVVFKTQLLAVNASIEAARAGHHGKGFSVVASEVASLAALSGKASSEIRDLLQTSSSRVVDIIDETANSIREGSAVCNRSSEAFTQIAKSVTAISDKVDLITAASREQEAGVSQTSTALSHMNEATSSTNEMAQRNAKLGQELTSLASKLRVIDRAMMFIVAGKEASTDTKLKKKHFVSQVDRILDDSEQIEHKDFDRSQRPTLLKGGLASRFRKSKGSSSDHENLDHDERKSA